MSNLESVRSPYPSRLSSMDPYDIRDMMTARGNKSDREGDAGRLPRLLTYGYNSMSGLNQKNTCIWSGGTLSWTKALSGIMWVAVHGMDSICVVTRIKDLEQEFTLRMAMFFEKEEAEALLRTFTNGLIGEVELGGRRISDFVDPSTKHRPFMEQIIKKPFGVVSVIPDTKALSAKYDEENAIKFLQSEMESGADFTSDKTVQTAICALDHLFRHEFKANEIQVFFWKNDGGGQAKALPYTREELDIDGHLAGINKPDSCLVLESPEEEEGITRS